MRRQPMFAKKERGSDEYMTRCAYRRGSADEALDHRKASLSEVAKPVSEPLLVDMVGSALSWNRG
jgi:hypothetical protein